MTGYQQSKFDSWKSKNRRDKGSSPNALDISQKIQTSKQAEYDSVLSSITDAEKIRIRELMYSSNSQVEFLSRMSDEGFNLNYLIAMGITTEDNIQTYLTLKSRGIDTYGLQDSAITKKVDPSYLREMTEIQTVYPDLLNIEGKNIQRTLNKKEYIREEMAKVEADSESIKNKYLPKYKETKGNVDDVASVSLDLDALEIKDNTGSTETEIKASKHWEKIFQDLKSKPSPLNEFGAFNEESSGSLAPKYKQLQTDVRRIYILANPFATPLVEGYDFIFVSSSNILNEFTIDKNNLLLITRDIPQPFLNAFSTWVEGVVVSGIKLRIATIQSSKVEHEIVGGVLRSLDKKSLDDYYREHSTENYIGNTDGTFLDISSLIEETETEENN